MISYYAAVKAGLLRWHAVVRWGGGGMKPRYRPDPLVAALRARREALGLTQVEVAAAIGYSLGALETWEEGRAQPKSSALLAYATAVEARIDLVRLSPDPLPVTDVVAGLSPACADRAERRDTILHLSGAGHSARQVAAVVGCSPRTVQRIRARTREAA